MVIQFYLEKIYGLLFDGNENMTRFLHLEELFKYMSILAFFNFVSVCNSKVKSIFFSVLYHLSVINSMQMRFVDLESENICFPESLALRLLGNLAMF